MKENVINETTQAPDPEPEFSGFIVKSGNTTFLVGLHFSEASKETLDDKLKKLIRKDVEADNF